MRPGGRFVFRIDVLRYQLPVSIDRQQELVRWSLVMLRLVYIADVAGHSQPDGDRVAELASIAEDAAAGRLPSQGAKMSEIPFELGQPWLDRLGPDPDLLVRRQNRRGVVDGSSIR